MQDRIISIEILGHLKGFNRCKQTLVKCGHWNIVFVKVESRFTRNIWKRSLVQTLRRYKFSKRLEELYLEPKEQSTKRHPVNISFPKTLVQHIVEVRSCWNRNKTYVPVFYRVNKLWVLVLVHPHSWIISYALELVPIFYYRDKTRVRCFIS